ncbi:MULTISPECIES: hypothetical protein [unclassified Okeania]|uniref:hypothetical protein n=1 Tax=unclassified Okeania TaxID=2634635 RepID=UPI00257F28C5|nr:MULTISPECIES: hypothetical protein [unclassified Okeania]
MYGDLWVITGEYLFDIVPDMMNFSPQKKTGHKIRHPKSKIKTKNLMLSSKKPLSAMEQDLHCLPEQRREDVNGIL